MITKDERNTEVEKEKELACEERANETEDRCCDEC